MCQRRSLHRSFLRSRLLSGDCLLTGETGPFGPALRSGALVGFLDRGNGMMDAMMEHETDGRRRRVGEGAVKGCLDGRVNDDGYDGWRAGQEVQDRCQHLIASTRLLQHEVGWQS